MTRTLLAAALFAVVATACVDDRPLGERGDAIIGGALVPSSQFPSVVALENGPGNWFCTGTLVHERYVLTAAHCVEGETAASLKIRFDDADVNDTSGGAEVAVAAVHGHPGYDGFAWDNDIAVIELAAPATGHAITPIHRVAPAAGTAITQVGYGDADDNGGGAGVLRAVEVANIDCATVNDPEVSGANLMCFDTSTGRTTCYGDSGGPSFVAGADGLEVAGVTSGGTADLCLSGFDLQTLVASELDFVDQYVPLPVTPPDPPKDDGGCAAAGRHGPGGALLLLGALGLRRRRRAR
ncbi:MAG: serine protease [Myxococcales bacterium]|nr:serine protease [Myxococcales bacterium]